MSLLVRLNNFHSLLPPLRSARNEGAMLMDEQFHRLSKNICWHTSAVCRAEYTTTGMRARLRRHTALWRLDRPYDVIDVVSKQSEVRFQRCSFLLTIALHQTLLNINRTYVSNRQTINSTQSYIQRLIYIEAKEAVLGGPRPQGAPKFIK